MQLWVDVLQIKGITFALCTIKRISELIMPSGTLRSKVECIRGAGLGCRTVFFLCVKNGTGLPKNTPLVLLEGPR